MISILQILAWLTLLCFSTKNTYSVEVVTSGQNTSIRGMSISSEEVIWVSGSNGKVGKSIDKGKTWRWMVVKDFASRDFRDIEAFDSSTAIAMAVDNPAIIVKTIDGGNTWKKVLELAAPGMFLDAMDFKNTKEGICVGDPLQMQPLKPKQFYIIKTFNGGDTWKEIPVNQMPFAQPDEAIFAASGTNIWFFENDNFDYGFVTGGAVSNLYLTARKKKNNKTIHIPVAQGTETSGTFSMATDKQKSIYCVGGDYKTPDESFGNFRYTTNMGATWDSAAIRPPQGYRSCVQIIKDKMLVACGPSGVDLAPDGSKKWENISSQGFNVCMVSKGKRVFFAGEKGKIGKLIY